MLKAIVLNAIAMAMFLGCVADVEAQVDGLQAAPDTSFMINKGMGFRGKATSSPTTNQMQLQGLMTVRMAHPHFAGKQFPIAASAHPDSMLLPMVPPPGLLSGIFYSSAQRSIYNLWLEQPRAPEDVAMATASGSLAYVPATAAFIIGPQDKLQGKAYRGTTCSADSAQNRLATIGKISLPMQPVDHKWSLDLAGEWREDRTKGDWKTMVMARINLHKIPKKAWNHLLDKTRIVTAINPSIDWSNQLLLQSIAEFKDPDPRKAPQNMTTFLAQLPLATSYLDLESCEHIDADLLLSGLEFRQDEEMHTLWYSGEVGVVGIGGVEIGKVTTSNSKIEYLFGKPESTDTLRIYLEFDELNWVYFEQYGETLHTSSSDIDGYNATLASRKKLLFPEGEEVMDAYLNRFVNTYIWRTGRY
jgi:hypothetical protein